MTINQISRINIFLYFALSFTLLLGLYFGEDSSGNGGFIGDFKGTLSLVKDPLNYSSKVDFKFPLHYYLTGAIYYFTKSEFILRIIYCAVSLVAPYIFFLCLKEKFKGINKNYLFLFSLIILILPSFRSGAIWPNTQVTAIIFFLISLYYFLKWQNQNNFSSIKSSPLLSSVFFMALAVYSRQLYALIFLYYVYFFFTKFSFINFIKINFIIFILSIPGIYFVLENPNVAAVTFNTKFYNSLLVNSSILSFYLIPFFSILVLDKKIDINFKNKNKIFISFITVILVIILSQNFDYNYKMGGGYFLKLSLLLFENLFLFYLSCVFGFLCLLNLMNKNNLVISALLLFGFSSWIIFQKYFEPMFLILLFLVFETKLTNEFLKKKKNIIIYLFFISFYFFTALLNNIFGITKSI